MTGREALEWLERDVSEQTPDSPASNFEALQRALRLEDGEAGARMLLATIGAAVVAVEPDVPSMISKALIFGARLARHCADLERLGEAS